MEGRSHDNSAVRSGRGTMASPTPSNKVSFLSVGLITSSDDSRNFKSDYTSMQFELFTYSNQISKGLTLITE